MRVLGQEALACNDAIDHHDKQLYAAERGHCTSPLRDTFGLAMYECGALRPKRSLECVERVRAGKPTQVAKRVEQRSVVRREPIGRELRAPRMGVVVGLVEVVEMVVEEARDRADV